MDHILTKESGKQQPCPKRKAKVDKGSNYANTKEKKW